MWIGLWWDQPFWKSWKSEGIDMSKYEEDYFRAGAADTFGKDFSEVTREERQAFKVA